MSNDGWHDEKPLHRAACYGQTFAVQQLLATGVDVDTLDKDGWTPLHTATLHNRVAVVRILLHAGARVDVPCTDSAWTALHMAADTGNIEMMCILLQAGASLEAKSIYGSTPLHLAAANYRFDAMRYLLEVGASVLARDARGRSAALLLNTHATNDITSDHELMARNADVRRRRLYNRLTAARSQSQMPLLPETTPLPHSSIVHIFSLLPRSDFIEARLVCRAFAHASTSAVLRTSDAFWLVPQHVLQHVPS